MSLAKVLSVYLAVNILIALGFILLRSWWLIASRTGLSGRAPDELKLHYWVIFGCEGDANYLPKAMAAVIIMSNPELLK